MEKGKIYFVTEPGGWWAIGRCLEPINERSDRHSKRGQASIICAHELKWRPDSSWCYKSSSDRTYREATHEERRWFEECERQQKYIPQDEIKQYSPIIY